MYERRRISEHATGYQPRLGYRMGIAPGAGTAAAAQISRYLRDPRRLLCTALALMIAAGFVMPTGAAWSDLYYLVCGPAILLGLWRGRFSESRPGDWRGSGVLLPVALIVWSSATALWGADARGLRYLADGFCTLVFFAGLVAALRRHAAGPSFAGILGDVLIVFGTLNAAAALVTYPWRNGIGGRLGGFGETRQAILGASLIAVAVMFALSRALANSGQGARPGARWRIAYLAAAMLMIGFIALTQSRGPLFGLIAGVLVLVCGSKRRWWILAGLIGLPALLLWLDRALRADVMGALTERGTSFRPAIWRASLARIAEHPWIGHGMGARLGFETFTFPHDLYLSLLFYSGLPALLLFFAVVWRLLGGVMASPGGPERGLLIALWANMLVSGLTDYGQIIKGPSPLWYIIWLPIAYSAVYPARGAELAATGRAWETG